MTIDRILSTAAPRIDLGATGFTQLQSAPDTGDPPADGATPFSALLGALRDDGMVPAEVAIPDGIPVPVTMPLALGLPAEQIPALDTSAVLAQVAGAVHPQVPAGVPDPAPGTPVDGRIALPRVLAARAPSPMMDTAKPATPAEAAQAGSAVGYVAPAADAPLAVQGPTPVPGLHVRVSALSPQKPGGQPDDGLRVAAELAAASRGEARAVGASVAEGAGFAAATWSEQAGSGFRGLPALRGTDRNGGRSVFLPLDAAAHGSAAAPASSASAVSGSAPLFLPEGPMAPGASSDIAHKVHYWVTRGVQAAEIQLDALGGSAVDVSITVQGREALIEFRSDQPDARRVLQEAMPQLRDMLRSEGLQLAGGFVGTSGQQQGQDRRDGEAPVPARGGMRTGTEPVAGSGARAGAVSAHGLDVFV